MFLTAALTSILVLLAGVCPSPQTALSHVYTNDRAGFTIRYPDTLRPVERDPNLLGAVEMGWELVVDFETMTREPVTVLRVIGKWPKPPTYPPMDLRTDRASCKTYHETTVGGRRAAVCVGCGRAACSWTVDVPGPPDFTILSLDAKAGELSEPRDGAYPIKSMIESMRFKPAGGARQESDDGQAPRSRRQ